MIRKIAVICFLLCFFLSHCEDIEDILTHVSGKVYSDNCKVVIAVKGDSEIFDYFDIIRGIDEISLRDAEVFRGYDLSIGNDSLYKITMLSFGKTYFAAIVDDGNIANELDTCDHIGFYGETDTVDFSFPFDTTFVYSVPEKIDILERKDKDNIDIKNFIEVRWLKKIMEQAI